MGKIIFYVAMSSDGFIADKNGGIDWLPTEPDKNDEHGYEALLARISTIVMGRKSYEQIVGFGEWAWKEKTTYVFSFDPLLSVHESIVFVNGDVKSFIEQLRKEKPNEDIWLLGGAELAASFAKEGLIDECIITVIPVLLKEGIFLNLPYENFVLTNTIATSIGLEQRFYLKK